MTAPAYSREWSAVSDEEREEAMASLEQAIASTPPSHPDYEELTTKNDDR